MNNTRDALELQLVAQELRDKQRDIMDANRRLFTQNLITLKVLHHKNAKIQDAIAALEKGDALDALKSLREARL